jgi:predicted kinase
MLFLIRGLPGSGKSTLASTFKLQGIVDEVFEADQYFGDPYLFDPKLLSQAHRTCLENTRNALLVGKKVAVANTFTTIKELKPYLGLGFPYKIYICEGNYGSVHDVPEETIERMKARWQNFE